MNTHWNFVLSMDVAGYVEHPKGKSLTIPDESISVRGLLERYTQGLDLGGGFEPIYGEEDADFDSFDLEKVRQLDLFDRQELANKYSDKIAAARADWKKAIDSKLPKDPLAVKEEGKEKPKVSPKSLSSKFVKKVEGKL